MCGMFRSVLPKIINFTPGGFLQERQEGGFLGEETVFSGTLWICGMDAHLENGTASYWRRFPVESEKYIKR